MFLLFNYTRLSLWLHTEMHPGPGIMVVYPYNDTEYEPAKLGSSTLAQFNKNMWCLMEEFGLEGIDFGGDNNMMGIWDGGELVLSVHTALHRNLSLH